MTWRHIQIRYALTQAKSLGQVAEWTVLNDGRDLVWNVTLGSGHKRQWKIKEVEAFIDGLLA